MKKLLLTGTFLLLGVFSVSAQEYQLPNLGFSNWKTQNGETTLTADNGSTQVRPGTEPEGWNGSNVHQTMDIANLVTKVDEGDNTYVKISNYGVLGNNIPGYLTLGTPWVFAYGSSIPDLITYAKYGDGGSYGGVEFTHTPDAISLKYRKTGNTGETSHIIAYLWNEAFTSNVPNKVEKSGGFFNPTYTVKYEASLNDVDRVIMGIQNDENVTGRGNLVASLDKEITTDVSSWTPLEVPFTYNENAQVPTMMNVILAASDYWTRSNLQNGTTLEVDDVKFVYYSDLKSLKYDGKDLDFSNPDNIKILTSNFELSKLTYTSGRGAKITVTPDESGKTVKIHVEGEDFTENHTNYHDYTIKILNPAPASEVAGPYNRWITVNMGGTDISESANNIEITKTGENTVSFSLDHFYLYGGDFGPVVIADAKTIYAEDGSIDIIAESKPVEIPQLGSLDIALTGNLSKENKLTATLDIPAATVTVNVGDIPFTTYEENGILKVTGTVSTLGAASVKGTSTANVINVIDLTGAKLAKDLNSSNFSAEANNTLYMIADGQTLDGNNVIQNSTCKNLVLTDGLTFNAPEEFTATNVTFNRKFTAGNLSTVVLPFSFDAADVNGTVYKLESVENGVLSFKSVEGTADANVPYLVQTEGDNLFKTETPKNVTVARTPETVENSITGTGVTHVGNFGETMTITSDGQTSWYGYNKNGSFVKVLSGTVKPFRSAIKSTGAAPSSFALKLDGTVTGILNLENPNAKVDVYTVSGVCVRKNVPAASALNGLSRGVYIVGGQKVVK